MVVEAELTVAATSPERAAHGCGGAASGDARFPQERAQRRHVLLFFFFARLPPPAGLLLRVSRRQKHATAPRVTCRVG